MPEYKIGNMFDKPCDLLLFTANSTLNSKGELVMGGGAALQVKQRYPEIPRLLGQQLRSKFPEQRDWNYKGNVLWAPFGLLVVGDVGAFQVKYDWRHKAILGLIQGAVKSLCWYCKSNPGKTIFLNYPGIGLGGLNIAEVKPLLDKLPPQVTIWRKS